MLELVTADHAREITDRIKVTIEGAWLLIREAYECRAWAALGYSSWDDYCTREFGASRLRLPREERQEVVASLRESGMSIRAIASATGTSPMTIQGDIAAGQVYQSGTPDPDAVVLSDDGPVLDGPQVVPVSALTAPPVKPVTGTDGKTYKTAPQKPRRQPLADTAATAAWNLRTAVERAERIFADDRFATYREDVAVHFRGHLTYAVESLQGLLDVLDNQHT